MKEGKLVHSTNSRRYAIDDPETGAEVVQGQVCQIFLGGNWVKGSVGHSGNLYVIEGTTQSSHRVTLRLEDYDQLASGKVEPDELVKKSFEFLLEHEPKESILAQFDLRDIERYFPNFEREIKRRLSR